MIVSQFWRRPIRIPQTGPSASFPAVPFAAMQMWDLGPIQRGGLAD